MLSIFATAVLGVTAASASLRPAQHAHASGLTPPVVHEPFTPLKCSGSPSKRTTLEQEGCAEQQILQSDTRIDALNRQVFQRLQDAAAKQRFVTAFSAWFAYRQAFCASESDVFEGGTEAPVIAAGCDASLNAQHVTNLTAFLHDLGGAG